MQRKKLFPQAGSVSPPERADFYVLMWFYGFPLPFYKNRSSRAMFLSVTRFYFEAEKNIRI